MLASNESSRVLAIIPARGGSKGIPNKNISKVGGIPLIGWTIDQAQKSNLITEIFVSTDSDQIAEYARSFGVRADPLRPDFLSTDESKTADTVKHVIEMYSLEGVNFEYIILLEPTSPLRKNDDIDSCIKILESAKHEFDAVVTIGQTRDNPILLRTLSEDGILKPFFKSELTESRRQELPNVYFPFGVAYLIKSDVFLRDLTFYPERTTGYPLSDWQCFEIDNPVDLVIVESLVRLYGNK